MGTGLSEPAKRAVLVAYKNGMTAEQGEDMARHVQSLLRESLASEEHTLADDEITELIGDGIFTEANPMLHADLALMGLMVRRGFLKGPASG